MDLDEIRTADDLTAQRGEHAAAAVRRRAESIQQVARGVRTVRADRAHRAGQHDRAVDIRQEMVQQRRRVGERVRAVSEDEAVVLLAARPDRARHLQPLGGGHVGRVELHQVEHLGAAEARQLRQGGEQRRAVQHGDEAGLGLPAGDGAAGRDEQDVFQNRSLRMKTAA